MRIDEIRNAQRAQPFQPFILNLADGRRFVIPHPEFILISHNNRTVIVDDLDGNIEMIDAMLVTSLSVPATESQSPGT